MTVIKTNLSKAKKATSQLARKGAVAVGTAHHHALVRPHNILIERNRAYRNWHTKKHHAKVHALGLAVFVMIAVTGSLGLTNVAKAFETLTQTDWSGGVGSSTTNQYSSAINADTSTPGEIKTGSDEVTGWCNTAICDTSFNLRQKLVLTSDQARTNYQVDLTIPWQYGMGATQETSYDSLRFIDSNGNDIPYFMRSKTVNVDAHVTIKVPTLNQGSTTVMMYFGNGIAASASSGADTFDFYEDFDGNSLDSGRWPGGLEQGFSVSNGSLVYDGSGNGSVSNMNTDTLSRTEPSVYEFAPNITAFDSTPGGCTTTLDFNLYDPSNVLPDQGSITFNCTGPSVYKAVGIARSSTNDVTSVDGLTNQNHGSTAYYRLGASGDRFVHQYSTDGVAWTDFGAPINESIGTATPLNMYFYTGQNMQYSLPYIYRYKVGATVSSRFVSVTESAYGKTAVLTSNIFDTGSTETSYGAIHLTSPNVVGPPVGVRIWSSDNADMSGATTGEDCDLLADGQQIPTTGPCTGGGKRYYQYQVEFNDWGNPAAAVTEVSIDHQHPDITAPTNPTTVTMRLGSDTGREIADGSFTNLGLNRPFGVPAQLPYYQWNGAADTGGAGVEGYCIYFGADNTADPLTTKGAITADSPLDTNGACPYAITGTSLDMSAVGNSANLGATDSSADNNYYLRIRTIDAVGNVSTDTQQFEFKLDTVAPTLFNSSVTGETRSGSEMEILWPTNAGPTLGNLPIPTDMTLFGPGNPNGQSGIEGIRYCISSMAAAFSGYCQLAQGWYGVNGSTPTTLAEMASGEGAPPIDATTGRYVADLSSNPDVDLNGTNVVYIVVMDNAGNWTNVPTGDYNAANIVFYRLNNTAPSAPQNLSVAPSTNTSNSFSFNWDAPADLVGEVSKANYCWSVNVMPDANHCSYAGKGITSLSSDAYATQPGVNTMYVVAKDEAGNIDYANRASVTFTANTTAPGAPRNLEVIDASNKATNSWKLALSWDDPVLPGSGVSKYKVYRSLDDISYTEVGSTTATSFVDSGLDQITYYYKVAACDNANNCGAQSNADSLMPTGRYTEPALLVAGPQVTDIKTRSARVFWGTDRVSDTKVAYGTSSGNYFAAEAYQSAQVTSHSIELPNLRPGTTYYYRAKWTDDDGNTGQYAEQQFTTAPAPVVSDVTTTSINLDRAGLRFTTQGAVKVKVYYGKSSGFGAVSTLNTSTDTSTYSTELTGLDDGTKYYYRVNTIDSSGFEYDGSVASFTTIARPRISNLRFQTIAGEPSSTQKVTWDTNVAGSSEVVYGPKGTKQLEAVTADSVTSHEVIIRGLEDDTQYTLVARTRDGLGNVASSETQEFRTALDTRPPVISEVNTEASIRGTGAEARGQIIVTWKTDEPSTSQVSYGVGAGATATTKTAEDARLTTDHIVIISDLATSSVYSVGAISNDKAGNTVSSASQSVVVGRGTDNIFSVIFGAIQKIFGFKL